MCYQNVRGLRTKLKDFMLSVGSSSYDLVCVSESWLGEDILNSEVVDSSYGIHRKDRNSDTSLKSRGGGVFIASKLQLGAVPLQNEFNKIEQVFVKISYNHYDLIVGCLYIPPKSHIQMYLDHISEVKALITKYPNYKLLIFGDYNLPNLKWNPVDLSASNISSEAEIRLCDEFALLGLRQFNYFVNHCNNILDLCFANFEVTVDTCAPLVSEDRSHPTLNAQLCFNTKICEDLSECYYSFKNANYYDINNYLSNINWIPLYSLSDVNIMVEMLYYQLYNVIELFVPEYFRRKHNFPSWFSSELRHNIIAKKEAHKMFKVTGHPYYYNVFSNLRKTCKELANSCYQNFVGVAEKRINEGDSNYFWGFIKNKTRKREGIPHSMLLDETSVEGELNICNLFAENFKKIYRNINTSDNFNFDIKYDINLSNIEISYNSVLEGLITINPNKGPGPDGLPNIFLKNCAATLAEPLSFIFNQSISRGIFPEVWKESYITPVFKSGNRSDVSNYRQISIQSSIPKLFEKLIIPTVNESFKNIIVDNQHGFFCNRSTTTNLFAYINHILTSMDQNLEVHSIYTDFQKAFDLVDHQVLIVKLRSYGVRGSLLSWFKSYLTGRIQQVKINNSVSHSFSVPSGVPQGSHLGPLLFSIFVNDIGLKFRSQYLLFADDLKLYRCIKEESDILYLQTDLDNLYEWCLKNNLHLNIKKCHFINFTRRVSKIPAAYNIDNELIKQESVVKDLGILLDSKLSFNEHYDHILAKANRSLGLIQRMTSDFRNINSLRLLYISLVRSTLEYNCIIWSPFYKSHINRFETLQLKFLKTANYVLKKSNIFLDIDQAKIYLNLDDLGLRREYLEICFFYKVINSLIDSATVLSEFSLHVPNRQLRQSNILKTIKTNTNYALHSPYNRITRSVNLHSSLEYFGSSITRFKTTAHRHLLNNNC